MKDFTLPASVDHGKLVLSTQAKSTLRHALHGAKDGTPILVTIEKQRAHRSLDANAFWWSCCITKPLVYLRERGFLEGWEPQQLHDYAKAMCLSKEDAAKGKNGRLMGDGYVIGGSTARLNTLQFYEFIERWRVHVAETFQYEIEEADPNWREKVVA